MFFPRPLVGTAFFALALLFITYRVEALPAADSAAATSPGAPNTQSAVTLPTCAFMKPQDWNLINGYDTGKLSLQASHEWKAFDSQGQVKWTVIPTSTGSLIMKASKYLRGYFNVISVTLRDLKGVENAYNFYISAGQICQSERVNAYVVALYSGQRIVRVAHYQRFKTLPRPKKGGPPP